MWNSKNSIEYIVSSKERERKGKNSGYKLQDAKCKIKSMFLVY